MPCSARPLAWMTIAEPGRTSRTMPVIGLSSDSVTSPPATRQRSCHSNSSSPSSHAAARAADPALAGHDAVDQLGVADPLDDRRSGDDRLASGHERAIARLRG